MGGRQDVQARVLAETRAAVPQELASLAEGKSPLSPLTKQAQPDQVPPPRPHLLTYAPRTPTPAAPHDAATHSAAHAQLPRPASAYARLPPASPSRPPELAAARRDAVVCADTRRLCRRRAARAGMRA